jgi:peptidoglycan/xylan/chitin deacetylase (PgdA/CDA1 family)
LYDDRDCLDRDADRSFGSKGVMSGHAGRGRRRVQGEVVALTFDDGPTKIYTSMILDALAEHDVLATCFVRGRRRAGDPDPSSRASVRAGRRLTPAADAERTTVLPVITLLRAHG